MTSSEIIAIASIAATAITAILSVVAQCWSASASARTARRIAELEIYQPKLCEAMDKFSAAYAKALRSDTVDFVQTVNPDPSRWVSEYQGFIASGYRVMALVPDADIHQSISVLMDTLGKTAFTADPETDATYRSISARLAQYISASEPRAYRQGKSKMRNKPPKAVG